MVTGARRSHELTHERDRRSREPRNNESILLRLQCPRSMIVMAELSDARSNNSS